MTAPPRESRSSVVLAVLWGGALVLLTGLWVRSPFTGPESMFLVWSLAAAPLLAWSWIRFRRWDVRLLPRGAAFLAGVAVAWAGVAVAASSGIGAEMALDGLVMRNGLQRGTGRVLHWSPAIFGFAISVAGLLGSLEARHRLARRDGARGIAH